MSKSLEVLIMGHPLGPHGAIGISALGPGAIGIEVAMPLEGPQFFQADCADRPIQEGEVNPTVVAVDAEMPHFVGDTLVAPAEVVNFRRRCVFSAGPGIHPGGVGKDRDIVGVAHIMRGFPKPLLWPLATILRHVVGPGIDAITTDIVFARHIAFPGLEGPPIRWPSDWHGGHRTKQHLRFIGIVGTQNHHPKVFLEAPIPPGVESSLVIVRI